MSAEAAVVEESTDPQAPDPVLGDRVAEANKLLTAYTLGAMAVAAIPVPLADLALVTAVQVKMLHGLSGAFEVPFKQEWGKSAVSALLASVAPMMSTPALMGSLAKFIPVGGAILGAGTLAALNGAATYALGRVFIQHFASGGTFLTFDPEKVRDYFLQQFEAGKEQAAELSKTSVADMEARKAQE